MKKSPLKKIFLVLSGLSLAAVLGTGLNSVSPVEDHPVSAAPRLLADGQETHGKNGCKGRAMLLADSGQETHGGKGGKGIA